MSVCGGGGGGGAEGGCGAVFVKGFAFLLVVVGSDGVFFFWH